MSGYSERRRIDPTRPLPAVTVAEATGLQEVDRLRRYVALREALADQRREAGTPRRSFQALLAPRR